MCGIFGTCGKNSVSKTIEALKKLEYRGYDSAGIALKRQTNLEIYKTVGRISALKELTKDVLESTNVIGHTRWATHGAVTTENAHPFFSQDGKFALVHNGIIDNFRQLKKQLLDEGVEFSSETDSEVVVQLLMKNFENSKDVCEALLKTVNTLQGSFALLLSCSFNDNLYAAKKGSPLCVGLSERGDFVCSDITTLRHFVDTVCFVDNNTVVELKNGKFAFFDFSGKPKVCKFFSMPKISESQQSFESYMHKEIFEIPKRMEDTFKKYKASCGFAIPKKLAKRLKRIYLVGCGTAFHSGLAASDIFRKFCDVDVFCVLASEFSFENFLLDKNTLVVLISQSGETADTVNACEFAKKSGAYTLALTNVANSSICFSAQSVFFTEAGQEIAVASTKAYNCQILALTMFALDLAVVRGGMTTAEQQQILDSFPSVSQAVEKVLSRADEILSIVKGLLGSSSVYFLGRTFDLATASEGSLKLKEISYVHSEAYASGELKHGTLALIESGVAVVLVACNKQLLKKYATAASEVLSRGANVLVVSPFGLDLPPDKNVQSFSLPAVNEIFYPILSVVPLQLFAFYFSQLLGCDTDKPRHLAKSVTVD